MKKIATLLPALLLLMGSFQAYAQGVLKLEEETHEFGKITEGTQAAHEFKFKNTGNQPVIISNVQASCGCTTPEWTKDPVLPGKTGIVKALYNSSGRPGAFHKTITITSNATEPTKILTIKGDVISKEEALKNLSPEEKAKSARIIFLEPGHDFGTLEAYRPAIAKVKIKNTGKQDLVITSVHAGCNCVSLNNIPEPIKPNKEGIVELSYQPNLLEDHTESVVFNTNDYVSEAPQFKLKAKVVKSLVAPSIVKEGANSVPFK